MKAYITFLGYYGDRIETPAESPVFVVLLPVSSVWETERAEQAYIQVFGRRSWRHGNPTILLLSTLRSLDSKK